jgi:hypothetical protein
MRRVQFRTILDLNDGIAAGFDGYCRKSTAPDSLLHLLDQMEA